MQAQTPCPFTPEQLQASLKMVTTQTKPLQVDVEVPDPGRANLMCLREAFSQLLHIRPRFIYSRDGSHVRIQAHA